MHRSTVMKRISIHTLLIIGSFIMVLPFIWMIITSLKTFNESMIVPPTILPETMEWGNYIKVFTQMDYLKYFSNTFFMTVGRTVGQLFLCSMAAYAFARLKFPLKNLLFILIIAVLMVPSQIVLIPTFAVMRTFGWIDTFYALIVPGVFSAFGVFLLRQFFMTIPRELDEAAKIDGCSFFGIYWRIILPLSRPALVALAIFTALASWNDFLYPLIMTNSDNMRVLSVGIANFQGQYKTDYPLLMAGSVLSAMPMILVFLFLQRYFIQGIALTGSKG
ncbi:carbohydrate ABC transporter permease [Lederbergia lenta]|uniref:Sugar ABC transporter permease n=1 Tax=Lederbergia lenta TaxID=1467 RepID=A0A2X4WDJ5_LEDLE|nr:carbohydrate ABC transporter permease [Lederbergia lenta]MCM3111962.1 carbohydrate ABC transporter permease [Lederbergia lenta]MEC2323137.1 carbohydrate ABC transporter permease [Lederbergia lenta]SQI62797.1 sugar ABC transporter permease [Lederbergia lenta]